MGINVLHLSDWHIGMEHINVQDLVGQIKRALGNRTVDLVLFTGDIIDARERKSIDVNIAAEAFSSLLGELNYINEKYGGKILSKEDILFVPGNHEIEREKDKSKQFNYYLGFLNAFYENKIRNNFV